MTKQDGKWIKTSTEEYIAKANAISRALVEMGLQKNDKIAKIVIHHNLPLQPVGLALT